MPEYKTSCLCGKTGLQITGDPKMQVCCHCTTCQKLNGSDYAQNLAFAPDQVKVAKGEGTFVKYKTSEKLTRNSCPSCYCLMLSTLEGDDPLTAVPVGTIDRSGGPNEAVFKPQHHIFYDSRIRDVPDTLPKWAGFPESSEKLG